MPDPGETHWMLTSDEGDRTEARARVVKRLLERGVGPATLETLLPEWRSLIDVAHTTGDQG